MSLSLGNKLCISFQKQFLNKISRIDTYNVITYRCRGLLSPANEVCEGYVFTPVFQSFCSQGGSTWVGYQVHPFGHPPPRTRCSLGRYIPQDHVHPPGRYPHRTSTSPGQVPPGARYTPLRPSTPSRTRHTPQDQVHPPGTRYTTPGPGTPPGTRHTPPGTRYTPRAVHAGRYGQQVGGILLEYILVCGMN